MDKSGRLKILVLAGVMATVGVVAAALFGRPATASLTFRLHDAVTGSWVWDAEIRSQDRVMRSFYQSDRGPVPLTFTNLTPGSSVLEISAPGYIPVAVPVELSRGSNTLSEPIELRGYEIPNLAQFVVVDRRTAAGIEQEFRPVALDGRAIRNHPGLKTWIMARVAVQLTDGIPARRPTEIGSTRGEELFRGQLEWEFDGAPERLFRYTSRIPGSEIRANRDPLWVVDYLIVTVDPRSAGSERVEQIMDSVLSLPLEAIEPYLSGYVEDGILRAHAFTSWNLQGGA